MFYFSVSKAKHKRSTFSTRNAYKTHHPRLLGIFLIMDQLVLYYLHQAGTGRADNGIGPVYSTPTFLQRGHGIGSFLGGLWLSYVFPLLWQCSKAVGSEAIVTGRNIIGDMAWNTDPNARIRDTVRRNGTEWAHRVIK